MGKIYIFFCSLLEVILFSFRVFLFVAGYFVSKKNEIYSHFVRDKRLLNVVVNVSRPSWSTPYGSDGYPFLPVSPPGNTKLRDPYLSYHLVKWKQDLCVDLHYR